MTDVNEQFAAAADEGKRRREAFFAHGQALAAMATSAAMQAHGGSNERRVTQLGQQGVLGHQTPWERGAEVAAREAVVGSDYGAQPLERNGGLIDWRAVSDSPAPAMVDRRFIDRPGQRPTGPSSLKAYMDGQR
jgi:hypothetical protein